jgi:hypothetical protein
VDTAGLILSVWSHAIHNSNFVHMVTTGYILVDLVTSDLNFVGLARANYILSPWLQSIPILSTESLYLPKSTKTSRCPYRAFGRHLRVQWNGRLVVSQICYSKKWFQGLRQTTLQKIFANFKIKRCLVPKNSLTRRRCLFLNTHHSGHVLIYFKKSYHGPRRDIRSVKPYRTEWMYK